MRICVSGGAGYLGSVLVPALLNEGHTVTALDNFSHGVPSLSAVAHHPQLDIVRGDVRDENLMASLTSEHDVIIPLAAIVGAPACQADRWTAEAVNYDAIDTLCYMLEPSQWVIFPTTNSGYGTSGDAECTEESPLNPISDYGWQKKHAEQRVMSRANSVSLRLATAFGFSPRMRVDLLLNEFVWRAVHDRVIPIYEPDARRNFMSVHDIARLFVHVIQNFEDMKGGVFNAGNPSMNITKLQLAEHIKMMLPATEIVPMSGSDPDKRNYLVSTAKLAATGFKYEHDLTFGVLELIKGFRQFRKFAQGNV